MSELSDYLSEVARERDIMGPRPFANATGLSPSVAQRLLDGTGTPKAETLQRVADKLGLSLDKLRRLNNMRPEVEPFVAPRQFDDLTLKQRRVVLNVGWALLEASQQEEDESPKRRTDAGNGVVEVDFSQQRVTEVVWTPEQTNEDVTHTE